MRSLVGDATKDERLLGRRGASGRGVEDFNLEYIEVRRIEKLLHQWQHILAN